MLAGVGLAGANALAACSQGHEVPTTAELASCHRSVQRAGLALQVARPEMSRADRQTAREQLATASARLLQRWANREGLTISADEFMRHTPKAAEFLEGVNAEAGLSEQERLSALSEAGAAPEKWREKLNDAFDCSDRLAS